MTQSRDMSLSLPCNMTLPSPFPLSLSVSPDVFLLARSLQDFLIIMRKHS